MSQSFISQSLLVNLSIDVYFFVSWRILVISVDRLLFQKCLIQFQDWGYKWYRRWLPECLIVGKFSQVWISVSHVMSCVSKSLWDNHSPSISALVRALGFPQKSSLTCLQVTQPWSLPCTRHCPLSDPLLCNTHNSSSSYPVLIKAMTCIISCYKKTALNAISLREHRSPLLPGL